MKKERKLNKLLVLFGILFFLVGTLLIGNKVDASSYGLSKSSISIYAGETYQLKVDDLYGTQSWSSSNPSVATVSTSGKVKGVKTGKATITCKVGSKNKYTCKVTVKKPNINKTKITIVKGKSQQLKLLGTKIKSISSSNKSVATVSKTGKVVARKKGTCKIIIKGTNNKKYYCTVNVETPVITKNAVKLNVGQKTTLGLKGNTQKIKWSSSNKNIATVNSKGVITAVAQGSVKITAKVNTASFVCIVDTVSIPGTYTKGEWIELLLKKVNAVLIGNKKYINPYFSDTKTNPHGVAIETAYSYGIIVDNTYEEDVPVFKPNETTTREFAAVTMVRALRYHLRDDMRLSCSDAYNLKYPKEDYVAIQTNLLQLRNNAFEPEGEFTEEDKQDAFKKIDEIQMSVRNIVPKEVVKYNPSLIILGEKTRKNTEYEIKENSDGSYIVILPPTEENKKITAGSSFMVPETPKYPVKRAFVAHTVNTRHDGKIEIMAVKPTNIAQVVEEIEYAGSAIAMPERRKMLVEGVTCEYIKKGKITKGTEPYHLQSEELHRKSEWIGDSISLPGKLHFDLGKGMYLDDGMKLKGSFDLEIPNITAKIKMECSPTQNIIDEMVVSISEQSKTKVYIECKKPKASGVKELASIPFQLGSTGLSLDLILSFYYDTEGNISIIYTVESTQGIQYKDNNFRNVSSFDGSFDFPSMEGSASFGLQFGLHMMFCEIWDIIGVDAQVGPGLSASDKNYIFDDLFCMDANIYAYAKVGLYEDTIFAIFWKALFPKSSMSKVIYNEDNSPLKFNLHFENMKRVKECTYGKGAITGFVFDGKTKEPIDKARVVVKFSGKEKANVYTDTSGKYAIENLSPGIYELIVSATGYSTFSVIQKVNKNTEAYVESALMLLRDDIELSQLSGDIIDGMTGINLDNVILKVRKGWGQTSGDPVKSMTVNESYSFYINPGNYTIEASRDGYSKNYVNVAAVSGEPVKQDITILPEGEKCMKIVLNWKEKPYDLDSHFFGPYAVGNGVFHTYYNKRNYNVGKVNIANLDLDDRVSYGPETTTLTQFNKNGMYSFYVHDYSNRRKNSSFDLSQSGAWVQVIVNGKSEVFHVPVNRGGTVWHVFDYYAESRSLVPRNRMYYKYNPEDVNLAASNGTEDTVNNSQETSPEEKHVVDYCLKMIQNGPEKELYKENNSEQKFENNIELWSDGD